MGTSTSYPGSPKWGKVKGAATRAVGHNGSDSEAARSVVADFVDGLRDGTDQGIGTLPPRFGDNLDQIKDRLKDLLKDYPTIPPSKVIPALPRAPASGGAGGGGSAGGGGGGSDSRGRSGTGRKSGGSGGGSATRSVKAITGRGLRPTAARFATFLSNVAEVGLAAALEDAGVDLATARPDEVALALPDIFCGPNSLLVDAELRDAASALLEELCVNVVSERDLEMSLERASQDLGSVLSKLFENYIMERFKTSLSEHLSKISYSAADNLAKEARELVATEMKLVEAERVDLTRVDWAGKEGGTIIDAIFEKAVAVYLS